MVIQVNGKVRGRLMVDEGVSDEDVKQRALDEPHVKQMLDGKSVRKAVVVPRKLVNFVVN